MDQTELDKILHQGEGTRIEFKEAQNGVPTSLYDTVCSFLNHEGGIILLGIGDDATVLGLNEQNLKNLKQDIVTALNNPDVLSPIFPLPVEEVTHLSGTLLYVRVPLSSFVHKHNNIIYDRENDSDFRVTNEARIADLYARKRNIFTENQIFPHLQIADLNLSLFDKVRARLALVNANHPWLEASNERILRDARLLRRDFATGEEGLTLAAALIFGTDEVIGNILPAYRVDILERRANMDRWDDRLLLKTNLIDSYLQALAFIKSKWPEKFYQDNSGERKDLRELIFRELVGNIIIHREYNNALPTEVIIYEDRVEAINPNRPRFRGPLNLDTFEAEPKNPNIRAFFNVLTWADEIGSGVKNMNKFVVAYTGGTHPIFIEDESFRSIIPMVAYLVGQNYQLYLHLTDLTEDQLGHDRIERLKGLSLDSRLKDMQDWDELAIALRGSWQEKRGELEKLRLLINNHLTFTDLKKRGSWEEKRGELLQKRTRVLLAVLLLTTLPISIEELADILGYKKKESLREGYLNPLRSHRLIEYTIPQANSPNQRYRITQRGINFLMGSVI
ncbi:RNA-binding domain-containing protein [Sphingobacterium pedocola]|uniref:AAA family ATPase n=1 Tax=Sphingobacterium pedocola TaxID=2082722 RepID=A0ABR9TBJ8_9SPHI|nr:RNA-binding domain-containing protein [Sphingobacterium pedocola]MBE8722711.1 AAA family ATPase [Sphingobacterium pedocola]